MKIKLLLALTAVLVLNAAGCRSSRQAGGESYAEAELVIDRAKVDLAERLGIGIDEITVVSVAQTECPLAALASSETECLHAQGATPCHVVRLMVRGLVFVYDGNEQYVHFVPDVCTSPDGAVSIVCVQLTPGHVFFAGRSMLPEGTCIRTQLFADGSPVAWWPEDACATREAGVWHISVPLGERGAPHDLDPAVQYNLHAWERDYPFIQADPFCFDLVGPATPLGTPRETD
jgi:hypothetical protein